MRRGTFLAGAAALATGTAAARAQVATPAPYDGVAAAGDFEALWAYVDENYCYFGQKATDWNSVRSYYGGLVREAANVHEAIAAFEGMLDELYDAHTHLGFNTAHSYRLPPYDIWAQWEGSIARVRAVRTGSPSAAAGLRAGEAVIAIGGNPIDRAAASRAPRFVDATDPDVRQWTLDSVLSGRHDVPRVLVVRDAGGSTRTVACDRIAESPASEQLSWKRIAPEIGYIRIPTFGDTAIVDAFDRALADLHDTRLLAIDVRENPGGDTAVTRPIMGRFIDVTKPYCTMTHRVGRVMAAVDRQYVDPRGPFRYRGAVRVLVDRWSASAAEGFAIGLDGMGKATVVGTRMMGLGAAIEHCPLPSFNLVSIRARKYRRTRCTGSMAGRALIISRRSSSIWRRRAATTRF